MGVTSSGSPCSYGLRSQAMGAGDHISWERRQVSIFCRSDFLCVLNKHVPAWIYPVRQNNTQPCNYGVTACQNKTPVKLKFYVNPGTAGSPLSPQHMLQCFAVEVTRARQARCLPLRMRVRGAWLLAISLKKEENESQPLNRSLPLCVKVLL